MREYHIEPEKLELTLKDAVTKAKLNREGITANYIPELANADPEKTSIAVKLNNGKIYTAGDAVDHHFTLQSVAKTVVLAGLLEEEGMAKVISWTGMEPTGRAFASVSQLELHGPVPANPFVNTGAIALCSRIPGNNEEDKINWLKHWVQKLHGRALCINQQVFESEYNTGNRNRAIAYLLKSNDVIHGDVEEILRIYFTLCSFEATVMDAANLPMLLANGGRDVEGEQILGKYSCEYITAVMATCGLYDASGSHLVKTGMPAKSGVSGFIISAALGVAGIATYSPRLDSKGTSVRGEIMLTYLSREMDWHFAIPQVIFGRPKII